jgi:Tol biopolymer transport system component
MARPAIVAMALAVAVAALASGSAAGSASGSRASDTLAFVSTLSGSLALTQSGLVQKPLLKARRVGGFGWSPDGRRIAYVSSNGLNVIEADGTGARALGVTSLDGRITWSPNARRIAFTAADGSTIRVYTKAIAEGRAQPLRTTVPSPVLPSWSPRGSTIAFTSANTNHGHIYTIRPDGTGLRTLTRGREESFPLLSPDGSLLMYQPYRCLAGTCGYGISVMRPDGSRQRLLAHVASSPGAGGLHAAWSPEGRRIAFLRLGRSIGSDILVVDVDRGRMRKVASDGRSGMVPAWSPDGRRIAYATTSSSINLMNADGSGKRPFVEYATLPAWQPRR